MNITTSKKNPQNPNLKMTNATLFVLLGAVVVVLALAMPQQVQAGAVSSSSEQQHSPINSLAALLDSPNLRIISDEDESLMQIIKRQIDDEFSSFKSINDVHSFLDKVKLLVQKHPKNVAFAQGDLKDLQKFLTQEIVTKLIRVDADPFSMPISDEKMPIAQRALEEDELTRKLFSGPLRSLIEAKRQQVSRAEDGNHRDGNFFSNFWCKISGSCPN